MFKFKVIAGLIVIGSFIAVVAAGTPSRKKTYRIEVTEDDPFI